MKTQKRPSSILILETLSSFTNEMLLSYSTPTVTAYDYDVKKFIEFLQFRGIKSVAQMKPTHITAYLATCKGAGKSEASLRRYYMAIQTYARFLHKNELINTDLTAHLKAPKVNDVMPQVPTAKEIERLLDTPDTTEEDGIRDRALLELMYSSGLRAAELIGLQLQDIGDAQVRVSCGKGGKTRVIPLTEQAKHWIDAYIEQIRGRDEGHLFVTSIRNRLNPSYLGRLIRGYAAKAGIPYVTPHTLRHACATHLLEQGADIRLIQEVLGHGSITSTQRYTQISSIKMNEMFHRFHPRKVAHA